MLVDGMLDTELAYGMVTYDMLETELAYGMVTYGMLETELAYGIVWLMACLRQSWFMAWYYLWHAWDRFGMVGPKERQASAWQRHAITWALARWRMVWVSEWHASTLQRKSHLCIPFPGIARPQPQFPHPCVCERFMSQERSLQCRKCLTCGRWSEDMFKPSEAMLGTSNGMQY